MLKVKMVDLVGLAAREAYNGDDITWALVVGLSAPGSRGLGGPSQLALKRLRFGGGKAFFSYRRSLVLSPGLFLGGSILFEFLS